MHFLSADYWQQIREGNASGLLLQQYVCEGVRIHFSCVCRGRDDGGRAGDYMTERLLEWFRGLSLKRLVRRPEKALREVQAGLSNVILEADDDLRTAGTEPAVINAGETGSAAAFAEESRSAVAGAAALAGVFCVGEEFFCFSRGEQRIYFMNTGFGRAHIRCLGAEGDDLFFQRGILQQDIGLLFAVGSFWEHITEQMIKEGLFVQEIVTEEQMRKHLRELGAEAQRRGGKDMAAVFVRTIQGV